MHNIHLSVSTVYALHYKLYNHTVVAIGSWWLWIVLSVEVVLMVICVLLWAAVGFQVGLQDGKFET